MYKGGRRADRNKLSVSSLANEMGACDRCSISDANGVGKQIGTLHLSDTKAGLQVTPRLAGLPAGDHGLRVHVNPKCGRGNGPNGQPAAGMAAGDHYDPASTVVRSEKGTRGDLPVLTVDESGKATKGVVAPHLTVADVKGPLHHDPRRRR
jgi:Cu-Zn family superoxide dismutase